MKGFELGMPRSAPMPVIHGRRLAIQTSRQAWKAHRNLEQDNHEVPENGVAAIMADEFF